MKRIVVEYIQTCKAGQAKTRAEKPQKGTLVSVQAGYPF
jgi:hypothetical protein